MITSPSYYDQIGGAPVVRGVVERFYERVLADDDLKSYFTGVDMPRLKRHMVMLLCSVLGGPEPYEGRDLGEAHAGMGITSEHYDKVGEHLFAVLRDGGVGEDILRDVGLVLGKVKSSIVAGPVEPVETVD
ncbi:group 1 truncated hemoglobin GlbN [Microbispora rosea subsp. aerata]|nr:group 1 truncated hemoglobin [Microbispora rosea]GGO04819.1 group 1 truncated hemoglobin GlbN [Microbispora rosea subsp. aerata]GIH56263.1 group 1 truncated hemoglobin GlbN [Microbispora rosea subsp. aerata]GLJ82297.1 group 1 truncated hemoglobin GlbN [Microbispora rosea subsp. aerata]